MDTPVSSLHKTQPLIPFGAPRPTVDAQQISDLWPRVHGQQPLGPGQPAQSAAGSIPGAGRAQQPPQPHASPAGLGSAQGCLQSPGLKEGTGSLLPEDIEMPRITSPPSRQGRRSSGPGERRAGEQEQK